MSDEQSSCTHAHCSMGQWTISLLAAAVCSLVLFAIFTGYVSKMQDSLTEQSVRMDSIQQRLIQTETQLSELQRALTGGMPAKDGAVDALPDAAAAPESAVPGGVPAAPMMPAIDMPQAGAEPAAAPMVVPTTVQAPPMPAPVAAPALPTVVPLAPPPVPAAATPANPK